MVTLRFLKTVYDALMSAKHHDGGDLVDMFVKLPSRREVPAYYEVV